MVKICDAGYDVTFTKIACTVHMRGLVLMTGRKDTKTGFGMLPIVMEKSTVSAAMSTINQGASDVLEPIALQAAHEETHSVPYCLANTNPKRYDISYQ